MKEFFVYMIIFYQKYLSFGGGVFSVLASGGTCKYEVSCSEYMVREIREVGLFRGVILGFKRILSCR